MAMDGSSSNNGKNTGIPAKWVVAAALIAAAGLLAALAVLAARLDGAAADALAGAPDPAKLALFSALLGKYRTIRRICLAAAAALAGGAGIAALRLLRTMEQSVEKMRRGEKLLADRGPAEFRALASAHNELLNRRESAVTVLHRETLTDALTGLSNRLAFEKYIAQLSRDEPHAPVTVFSLDVNGLKETNDRQGHTFGDELLRNCAACIRDVFAQGEGRQCFRFGGDEFSAFWVDVPRAEIEPTLERFAQEQQARGVSISVGWAHTEDFSGTSVTELYEEADRNMYDDKTEFHRKQAQEVLDWLKLTT